MTPAIITTLEWTSTVLGLLGAWVLATNTRFSKFGWLAFLVANVAAMGFAIGIDRQGLLLQQAGFAGSSLLGIIRAGTFKRLVKTS